ncbi:MAG: LPS export ABC transporter periplasmic protein LptC [Hyphococcus sp.]
MSAVITDHDGERPARGQPIRGRKALESLTMRSRTTGEQALARSRLVRRLRIVLPLAGLLLIVAILLTTRSNTVDEAFLDDFKDITGAADELRMASPRFAGVDDKGRPFEITADSALQNADDRNYVELYQPRAVQGDGDATTVVTANTGLYQSEENILQLNDNVTLSHEIGADQYILRSPAATVQIKDEIVTSDAGVSGESNDGGTLRADRMKAYNADGRVIFEGNVSMRIYPKSGSTEPASATPNSADERAEEQEEVDQQ